MDKQQIRKELLVKRNRMTLSEVSEKSAIIQSKVIKCPEYSNAEIVLAYSDFKNEVMTSEIIRDAITKGKKVFLPKVVNSLNNEMIFYRITPVSDLQSGYFGISEPEPRPENAFDPVKHSEKTVMIVPGVGFDKHCNRLGFGKGFYDRFLQEKENLLTIGICYDFQILPELPVDSHDIPLNFLFSESSEYKYLR